MVKAKSKPSHDLATLLKQRDALDKEIAAVRAIARKASLAQVLEAIALHEFDEFELGFKTIQQVKSKRVTRGERTFPAKKVSTPMPPKYVNPETGATWSGRGHMPHWMVGDRDDYLIPVAETRTSPTNGHASDHTH